MTEAITTREISIDIGEYRGFDYIVDLYTRHRFPNRQTQGVPHLRQPPPRPSNSPPGANVPTYPDGMIDHRHHIDGVRHLIDWIYDNQKETRS